MVPQILWFTHPTFFKRSSNFQTQFWCSMTSARLDFVLCPTLYGWCLSHAWCPPWIERTREICFLYKIDRPKVAQYFSAHSKYGVRRALCPNFYRKPASHSSNFVKFSFDLLWQLQDLTACDLISNFDSISRRSLAMVRAMRHVLNLH